MDPNGVDRSNLRRAAPVAAWSVVVVLASVAPPPAGGLSTPGPLGVGADKWLHLGAYWITGLLAAAALRSRTRRALVLAATYGLCLGAGLELVQTALPARAFDLVDAADNALGSLLGAGTYRLWRRLADARGDAADRRR
jgi:VanZ family protein